PTAAGAAAVPPAAVPPEAAKAPEVVVFAGKEGRRFKGHQGAVTSLALLPGGKRLYSGGLDGTVRSWDVAPGKAGAAWPLQARLRSLAVSEDGQSLAAGSDTHAVVLSLARGLVATAKPLEAIPGAFWHGPGQLFRIAPPRFYTEDIAQRTNRGGPLPV